MNLIQSSADFVATFEPPDYLIEGILQRRFIYSLTGLTGSGKSAVALLLSAATALKRTLAGRTVEKRRALYLAGENPDDIKMRWILMSEEMNFDIRKIDVHFIEGTTQLSENINRIREEVKRLGGVQLIIVDTSAAYFEGESENDNAQAGDHARMLRSLTRLDGGPCVVVNCHPTKYATDNTLLPRGGGAFLNEMDGNMPCINDDGLVRVQRDNVKFRGPQWDPIVFELLTLTTKKIADSKGRLIPTVMAKALSDQEHRERERSLHKDEDRMLIAMRKDENASIADIVKATNLKGGKSKAWRIMQKLEKDKLVKKVRGKYSLTKEGENAAKNAETIGDDESETIVKR
jgi:uncharacterized membrane protein